MNNKKEKVLMLLKCLCNGYNTTSFVYNFIENASRCIDNFVKKNPKKERPLIISVKFYKKTSAVHDPDIAPKIYDYDIEELNDAEEINSSSVIRISLNEAQKGSKSSPCHRFWMYIPTNYKEEKRMKELICILSSEIGHLPSVGKLKDYWEKNKDKITAIFKRENTGQKLTGDINTNSMVLFSGPEHDTTSNPTVCLYRNNNFLKLKPDCCVTKQPFSHVSVDIFEARLKATIEGDLEGDIKAGCIYMGDYVAKRDKLKHICCVYSKYFKQIGCLQIPHHGSGQNFDKKMLEKTSPMLICIISAGLNNPYHHPDASVVEDIILKNKYLCIVDEFTGLHMTLEF